VQLSPSLNTATTSEFSHAQYLVQMDTSVGPEARIHHV